MEEKKLEVIISYIGDIPHENKKEIINFKLKDDDKIYNACNRGYRYNTIISRKQYLEEKEGVQYYMYTELTKLNIIATIDLFDMNNKIIDDYQIKIIDKDPIVLKQVIDGYLIISKW